MALPKISFQQWLLGQLDREDGVGSLAQAVLRFESYATIDNAYPAWRKTLLLNRCAEQLDALRDAWTEYLQDETAK